MAEAATAVAVTTAPDLSPIVFKRFDGCVDANTDTDDDEIAIDEDDNDGDNDNGDCDDAADAEAAIFRFFAAGFAAAFRLSTAPDNAVAELPCFADLFAVVLATNFSFAAAAAATAPSGVCSNW